MNEFVHLGREVGWDAVSGLLVQPGYFHPPTSTPRPRLQPPGRVHPGRVGARGRPGLLLVHYSRAYS